MSERFPLEPLEEFVARRHHHDGRHERPEHLTVREVIAVHVGVGLGAVEKWQSRGLSVRLADRAAVAVGAHPAIVWPELWSLEA